MAGKKKQAGYEGALDSIYKLFFSGGAQAGKRKPLKLNGINPADKFTSDVVDLVTSPMMGASDQAAKIFDSTFGDADVLKFQLDMVNVPGYDPNAGRIRVKVKDLPKFLSNPGAFVSNALKKAEAQRNTMALWGTIGKSINTASVMMYAKRAGMSTKEAFDLGVTAGFPDPGPASQQVALESVAEMAALKAGVKDVKKAQKLAKDAISALEKETDSMQFFGTKSTSTLEPGLSADDLKTKIGKEGVAAALYSKPIEAFITPTKGDAANRDIKQYLDSSLSPGMKSVLERNSRGEKLSRDERALVAGYQKDLNRLIKTNDRFLGRLEAKGYNLSDPQVQKYLASLNKNLAEINTGSDYLDGFGSVSNVGLMQIQYQLNDERFKATGEKQYETSKNVIGTFQSTVYPGSQTAYVKLQGELSKLRESISQQYGVNSSAIPPKVQASLRDFERALAKLEKDATRPGLFNNAPRYRDAIIGGFDAGDNGEVNQATNRAYFSVSNSMRKLYSAQAEYYESIGDLEKANSYRSRANRVTIAPGFDANVLIGRVRFIKGAWDAAVKDGGFWPSIVNGSFWDQDFSPSKRVEGIKFFYLDKNELKKGSASYIMMPRDDLPIYAELTGLYYLTPQAILKTFLWNGEGFGYGAAMSHRSMMKTASSFLKKDKGLLKLLSDANYPELQDWFAGGNFVEESLKDPAKFKKLIDFLEFSGGKYKPLVERLRKFSGLIAKFEKVYNYLKRPSDLWNGIMTKVQKVLKAPIGAAIKAFIKNPKWRSIVDKWVGGKIGLYQVIELGVKAAVKAILAALGVSLSATGLGLIVTIATAIVVSILMKIVKPFIEFAMWGVRGGLVLVLGLILFLVLLFSVKTSGSKLLPSYGVPPNTNLDLLPASQDMYPVDDDFGDVIVKPGQKCPVEGISYCGGGVKWHSTNSTRTPAIDVTSSSKEWVAPMDGSVIDIIDQSYCPVGCTINGVARPAGLPYGGTVRFQADDGTVYRLIHVKAVLPKGKYKKGTVIAKVYTQSELPVSCCWTGEHWHLDVVSGGKWVDANKWYTGLGCSIPACYGD